MGDDPGFGVYVHWPFCAQKCPYCDFNSHVRHEGWDEARFVAAYCRELDDVAARTDYREVRSIFFGGGTPSLMQPESVADILDHIASLWSVPSDAEITLEANPGSVEAARFAGYRAAGVNRVSIGVQSLHDDELKRLGRLHSAADAKAAIDIARQTFDRFSFDLIYARPGQTPGAWHTELSEALRLVGGHVSLYQLTIEPDTPYADLHRLGKLIVPDPEASLALYEVTQELTEAHGLVAYEISNHAIPDQESVHNLIYWRYGDYAGVGPGAHGRLTMAEGRIATHTERSPEAWVARVEEAGFGIIEAERLDQAAMADEMLLMGLRLSDGLSLDRLAVIGRVQPRSSVLADLEVAGMLRWVTPPDATSRGTIQATGHGRFILNELVLRISRSFEPLDQDAVGQLL